MAVTSTGQLQPTRPNTDAHQLTYFKGRAMRHVAEDRKDDVERCSSTISIEPPFGSVDWIQYCGQLEGHLPSPIDVSLTGSTHYPCPPLVWFNFDVCPHKIKLTNTGYTLVVSAKWKAERPYLVGGPLREKHIFSQMHFHWGSSMDQGSDHSVDKRRHPAELQLTFFKAEYLTQEEALKHRDGVLFMCFLIRYGVNADPRLQLIVEGLVHIFKPHTGTKIGPYPLSSIIPTFSEDYLLYWGTVRTTRDECVPVRWLLARAVLYANNDQMNQFRKLMSPHNAPIQNNYRPLQERQARHVFFVSPHYSQHNTLLPIPRVLPPSISILSPVYRNDYSLLPSQNAYMIPKPKEDADKITPEIKTKKSVEKENEQKTH